MELRNVNQSLRESAENADFWISWADIHPMIRWDHGFQRSSGYHARLPEELGTDKRSGKAHALLGSTTSANKKW